METITALEFRQTLPAIIRNLKQTGGVMVTHRGKPAGMFVPLAAPEPSELEDLSDDSFYRLWELADAGIDTGKPLTNEEIDRLVYGI